MAIISNSVCGGWARLKGEPRGPRRSETGGDCDFLESLGRGSFARRTRVAGAER